MRRGELAQLRSDNARLLLENGRLGLENVVQRLKLAKYEVAESYVRGEDGDVSAWRASTILGFPKIPVTAEEDEAWEQVT